MFKKNIEIMKDYSSIVNLKNKYLVLYVICNILSTIMNLVIPLVAALILEQITKKLYTLSFIFVILLGILYIINNIFQYGIYYFFANFLKNTYVNIHEKIEKSIYRFDEEFTSKISISKIINSSNIDIINTSELPSFLFEFIIQITKFIIILLVFLKENILIGIYVLIINLIYVYFSNYCNLKSIYYLQDQKKYADNLTNLLQQILSGLKDIKCYNLSSKLNKKFDKYRKDWQNSYYLKRKYYFLKQTIGTFIIEFGKILLYIFLILLVIDNKISLTIFILLISYYEKLQSGVKEIMNRDASIKEESVSMYRIIDIISYKRDSLKMNNSYKNNNLLGNIEFRNVSFKYNEVPILKEVSFKIEPNKINTIVGKSGAGKTTIFNLLLKFYEVDKGSILFDNVNIYEYNENLYNSSIAVVNQDTFIFNMSIRENLSLVDSNKKRQIDVCKKVGIHEFIMTLPNGYNTVIKENGINISGGQKKLISLARALLMKTKILLFDEVTSSLDPATTSHIINLLDDLKKNYTILIITHNKQIMKKSDQLIIIDKGKIVGTGTHNELIKNNKKYKELVNRQNV